MEGIEDPNIRQSFLKMGRIREYCVLSLNLWLGAEKSHLWRGMVPKDLDSPHFANESFYGTKKARFSALQLKREEGAISGVQSTKVFLCHSWVEPEVVRRPRLPSCKTWKWKPLQICLKIIKVSFTWGGQPLGKWISMFVQRSWKVVAWILGLGEMYGVEILSSITRKRA